SRGSSDTGSCSFRSVTPRSSAGSCRAPSGAGGGGAARGSSVCRRSGARALRQAVAPVRDGPALEHVAELLRGLGQERAAAPVEDHAVLPDRVHVVQLALAVAARHLLGIGVEAGLALGGDPRPLRL